MAEYYLGVEEELVLLSQAAKEVGVSSERLRQLIAADRLPAQQLGGRYWYIRRSDLDAFIKEGPRRPGWPKGRPRKPAG